jgi:hypothetical protein
MSRCDVPQANKQTHTHTHTHTASSNRLTLCAGGASRTDGIYISNNSYFRSGQTEGHYYQPLFQVEYYRFLRFYSDQVVVAIVSPEPPKVVAAYLTRNENTIEQGSRRKYDIQLGHYHMVEPFKQEQQEAQHKQEARYNDTATNTHTATSRQHGNQDMDSMPPVVTIHVSELQPTSRYARVMHMEAVVSSYRRGWFNRIALHEYYSTRLAPGLDLLSPRTPQQRHDEDVQFATDASRSDFPVHTIKQFVFVPYLSKE